MTTRNIVFLVLCVCAISVGQVMFKSSAGLIEAADTRMRGLAILAAALALYGGATLGWIALLTRTPLTFAYVFMAFSYVIVPVLSVLVLREKLTPAYWLGAALIVVGVMVAAQGARNA